MVKLTGDGALVEFPSVVEAVRCAVEIQQAMVERNADVSIEKRVKFRSVETAPRLALDEAGTNPPLPDRPSIAVLPFTNIRGDPEQEYFADGIVEEIITALSRFPSLFVIARNSSFTYKGKAVDIKQIGRELGVRYVLEGSVRKAGNRVRITGQLIQAETGGHIWAEQYDGDLDKIFDLQDQITSSVAGAVVPSLEKAEIERAHQKRAKVAP
jgi:TolB-like protein